MSCRYETASKCASGSAVEHLLAKEGVAGSIPVSRSFYARQKDTLLRRYPFFLHNEPPWGSKVRSSRLPTRSVLNACHRHAAPSRALFLYNKFYTLEGSIFSASLRSAHSGCPPDTLRRLALSLCKKSARHFFSV